jgi:hypothetical protein
VIADRLDQRSESAVARVEQTGAALDESASRLESSASTFAHDALGALDRQSGEVISRGLGREIGNCIAHLQQAGRQASTLAQELEQMRAALRGERRRWVWLGSGALLTGSVLAIATAAYVVKTSRDELRRNAIETTLLRAYNQADVTLCDGRLCANIDKAGQRFGDQKQYRPVKPRK